MTEISDLLALEWEHARSHSLIVADGPALSITPRFVSGARERTFSAHPHLTRLHMQEGRLKGDLSCDVDSLPFDDECMQLITARHLFDDPGASMRSGDELLRILAPGGLMILYGFNPLSSWRIWWLGQSLRGIPAPDWSATEKIRRTIAAGGRVSVRRNYLGGSWPLMQSVRQPTRGRRWHGVCCVEIRKERAGSRPVPLRARNRVVINGDLAHLPSRRVGL